uniref:F-box domain-containing protein n=1 Tax=Aegilops tauschii TaxID=37682 RepID=M8B6B0_AEGTA
MSTPRGRRPHRPSAAAEADALISLPTGVLDDILDRVGLLDAVRTSALSRAWRRRWEDLPSIDFYFPRPDEAKHLRPISFDAVLALPASVFACRRLTNLRLHACAIPPLPAGFEGFPELRKLALTCVRFRENGEYQLEEIIATSPSLEKLVFWEVKILGDFKEWVIQGPNIQDIQISSSKDLGWILGELPSLHSANIDILDYLGGRDFAKFLAGFSNITKLVICTRHAFTDNLMRELNGAIILERLQCKFGNLKSLTLYTQFCELPSILSTYCLLRNAPNLERLKILIDNSAEQKFEAHEEFQNSQWTGGMCANLQFVQITGIHWLPNEMTFIELILSKARLFCTLFITHGENCSMSNEDAMNKILSYRRASTCAEILFKGKASVTFFRS